MFLHDLIHHGFCQGIMMTKILSFGMASHLTLVQSTWSGCLGRFFDSGTDLGSFDSITHHSGHDLTTYSSNNLCLGWTIP